MGKNYVNGKTFLEKRYDDNMELEDAVHTAILTLKEGFEGQVNLAIHRHSKNVPLLRC
jgi:20S proteasome subunit alpha 2